MINNKNNYCVILAGGPGSRLWPLSREQRPKQFIDVLGTGETLLQTTYKRFAAFIDPANIIVVTNEHYLTMVKEQLPNLCPDNILMEPMRRNTVPAVIWAAMEVKRRNPEGRLVVSPSDQNISDQENFTADVLRGLQYVGEHQRLLTLGAKPSRAEISYGYIQMEKHISDDIYKVQSFTEKPEPDFAKMFYESDEFLWNTGLFVWQAETFLNAVSEATPEFSATIEAVRRCYQEKHDADKMVLELFSTCPNLSIEQSVLEKSDNVDVMLCHFGWADLGTWQAVHEVIANLAPNTPDDDNVVIDSKSLLYDCSNCLVKLPEGHVAVLQGLDDYVVVEEGNVLVVCKKSDKKNIRKFVNDARLNLGEDFV